MEQFADLASATLVSSISSTDTSLTISNAVNMPSSGTLRIRIDNELITVTDISGSTYTITRGAGNTTAAAHSAGATITHIVTAEALNSLVSVQSAGTETSNTRILDFANAAVTNDGTNKRAIISFVPLDETAYTTPPDPSTLTWVNQTSNGLTGTVTNNSYGGWSLTAPAGYNGDNNRMLVTSIPGTTPWSFVVRLAIGQININYLSGGLVIRESSTGKFYRIAFAGAGIQIDHYSNPNSYNNGDWGPETVVYGTPIRWAKITYDGTSIGFWISHDGANWMELKSISKTAYFTSGPDQVGVYADSYQGSGGLPCTTSVLSWTLG